MYLYSESVEDWFNKNPNRKIDFDEDFKLLYDLTSKYASHVNDEIHRKVGIKVNAKVSKDLLYEIVMDTLSDLERIQDFHNTPVPNRLKKAAYIVYWFVKHKPLSFERTLPLPPNSGFDCIEQFQFRFLNEEFGVRFLMGAVFPNNAERKECSAFIKESRIRRNHFQRFLLYYLVYRMESAKSIEAILLALTISPAWEIDTTIWH